MKEEDKKVLGALVIGGVIGWLLHLGSRPATGNTIFFFQPNGVAYEIRDGQTNLILSDFVPRTFEFEPGEYSMTMTRIGG